ncbi:hypothetical protein B0H12DRAFT_1187355 [Mycena haematopus]|nr:hypothetical protein B0H12DRAFT_1187355 [Mycena haematopus]
MANSHTAMHHHMVNNTLFGGVGGPGGEGHGQGTGGNGGNGEGAIQHYHSETSTVNNFNCRLAEVQSSPFINHIKQQILAFSLIIAIVGGIIAWAVPCLDLANFPTNLQAQISSPPLPQVHRTINNCPPPSRIFHGRQSILDKMHTYFSRNQTQQYIFLLYGVGGAGKTQISLKFIQTSSSFSETFYIDASTQDTIETGLKNIALMKGGNTPQDALDWLQKNHDQWLLFFDNADDPKIDLHKFLPLCTHGNIIITSRNPGLSVYAGLHHHVSGMEETDALELLLKSAAQTDTEPNRKIAAEIVKLLYCLPLAIIQAGAFISESGDLHGYIALYHTNRAQLLSERPAQSHDNYAWTVYTTWHISFDQLSDYAKRLFQLCSILHHEGIPEEIFVKASAYDFPTYGLSKEELQKAIEFLSQFLGSGGVWDPLRFLNATKQLRAYSLINMNLQTKEFSIHPLVHEWTQSILDHLETDHYSIAAILGMAIAATPAHNQVLLSKKLLPHLSSVLGKNEGTIPDFRIQYSWVYFHTGKLKEVQKLLEEVLAERKKCLGEDHVDTLHASGNLAMLYNKVGKFEQAKELKVKVVEKQSTILGIDHPDTLRSMLDLAMIYCQLNMFHDAKKLEITVVETRIKLLGMDHPETLRAMANLSSTYRLLHDFNEAEQLEIIVLEKTRNLLGDDHLETVLARAYLAATYHDLGKFVEADKLRTMVVEKRKNILGEDHPQTLQSIGRQAQTYCMLGKLKQAEELQVVVLKKQTDFLGADHRDTLYTTANLAWTYHKLGRFREAEELQIEVLEKQRSALGEGHTDTVHTMENLALTQYKLDKFQEAEGLQIAVLENRRSPQDEGNPHTIQAMCNLEDTYTKLGKVTEAEELSEIIKTHQKKLKANKRDVS